VGNVVGQPQAAAVSSLQGQGWPVVDVDDEL